MGNTITDRLKLARHATGLSTREVAQQLKGRFAVSHATINNYEQGRSQPRLDVLSALAGVYGRPLTWFLESGPTLHGIRYRSHRSKLRVADKHWFEAQALRWLEAYIRIEKHLDKPLTVNLDPPQVKARTAPEDLAVQARHIFGIGPRDPVPSVIDVMEQFGIRVLELATSLPIDGMAATLGSQPTVILNPTCSNDRKRLNASHEMFHVLLGHCADTPVVLDRDEHRENEDSAFASARHFLLPKPRLHEAFEGKSFVKLVKFKEMYGISLSAMIYAARQEKILSEQEARFLWIEFSKRGWRAKEPGEVRDDRATRFEQLIDEAVTGKKMTWAEAARITGVREIELRDRVRAAMGITGPEEPGPGQEGGEPTFSGLRLAQ